MKFSVIMIAVILPTREIIMFIISEVIIHQGCHCQGKISGK